MGAKIKIFLEQHRIFLKVVFYKSNVSGHWKKCFFVKKQREKEASKKAFGFCSVFSILIRRSL
jgi:hypothetical protein